MKAPPATVVAGPGGRRWRVFVLPCLVALAAALGGCTSPKEYVQNGFKVGPNYGKPPAPVAKDWIDADDMRVRKDPDDLSRWWKVFGDPVLDKLICDTYRQNLTLRQAGFRVLEARAQLGIAVGNIFPQQQSATGSFDWNAASARTAGVRNAAARAGAATATAAGAATGGGSAVSGSAIDRFTSQWNFGFNLAWELDFWGRFRRAVESASASLDASVEEYDDVLVTLLSEVATAYVNYRTAEQRIKYGRENVALQEKTVKVIEGRKKAGVANQLDVDQAHSILAQTAAGIPELEIQLRQFANQLCILTGIPPEDLTQRLGAGPIPAAPPEVAVGIPADLLRRRPDVRRAERLAAAQSAQIGIAEAEFYPHISLVGNLGWSAEAFKDLFRSSAMTGSFGPQFQWNILNYGRILNNVRLQDAKFNELVAAYQSSVLNAQLEAENGLVTFLKSQQRARLQAESVEYAEKAVKVVLAQYELGTVQITQLIQIEQNLVLQQDTLAIAQGEIPAGLIQVYKALGGGWQIRINGCEPTPAPPPIVSRQPIEQLQPPRLLPPTDLPQMKDGK